MATAQPPLRVLHVIPSLEPAGAEMMLLRLLERCPRPAFESAVVTMVDGGALRPAVEALGVPVISLGMRLGVPDPRGWWRLRRILRQCRPDLVQGWMYHANLLASLAAGRVPVVWGLHHTSQQGADRKWTTRLVVGAGAHLARRLPARVIACAQAAADHHLAAGYDPATMVVVPNGVDLQRYQPDPAARATVRAELGLAPEALLVGVVARFHPFKDHRTLLAAAGLVARTRPDVAFALAGRDITPENATLADWIGAEVLAGQVHLLGQRDDLPRLNAAFDLGCLSSLSEALPVSLLETMAAGVPCVVTDVGDCARVVGETGRVVPPRDPAALAAALGALLAMTPEQRLALGRAARERIAQHYSLESMVAGYQAVWREVAGRG